MPSRIFSNKRRGVSKFVDHKELHFKQKAICGGQCGILTYCFGSYCILLFPFCVNILKIPYCCKNHGMITWVHSGESPLHLKMHCSKIPGTNVKTNIICNIGRSWMKWFIIQRMYINTGYCKLLQQINHVEKFDYQQFYS